MMYDARASVTKQITTVTLYKSHNAHVLYPTMHHFVTEMCTRMHISVTESCIVGYGTGALWGAHLCNRLVHCGIWDWCIVGFVRWVYYLRHDQGNTIVILDIPIRSVPSLQRYPPLVGWCPTPTHLQRGNNMDRVQKLWRLHDVFASEKWLIIALNDAISPMYYLGQGQFIIHKVNTCAYMYT